MKPLLNNSWPLNQMSFLGWTYEVINTNIISKGTGEVGTNQYHIGIAGRTGEFSKGRGKIVSTILPDE